VSLRKVQENKKSARYVRLSFKRGPLPRHNDAHGRIASAMASTLAMSSRALRVATVFARHDAGSTSGRGGESHRARGSRVFSHEPRSSRRAVASTTKQGSRLTKSTRGVVNLTPRAVARDASGETPGGPLSNAQHTTPTPSSLWDISGRSSDVKLGVGVGSAPAFSGFNKGSGPPVSPTLFAGVALLGGVGFVLVLHQRAKARNEELDLQRRFRGDLIRRRVGTTVGRGQTNRRKEVDYSGDMVMSVRDVALARSQGLVRGDGSKTREEDLRFLKESAEQNARDAGNAAAISRGERNAPRKRSSVSTPKASRPGAGPQAKAPSRTMNSRRLVQVTLGVTCVVGQNQTVWATGGPDSLGRWDARNATRLQRLGRDRWQCVVAVPFGALEYAYVLGTVSAKGAAMRVEQELGDTRSRIVVSDVKAQLFVEEVAPVFQSTQNGRGGTSDASQKLATSAEALRDGARARSFVSDVNVAERLRGGGGQFAAAAAAFGAPAVGTDITEVAMNDDVKVVEDFTDVSDDELAALVAELKRELGNT